MIRPHLAFVHGWGFDSTFWRPVRSLLTDYSSTALDLGFFGRERLDLPEECGPVVAVGHSLGVVWLARQSFFDFQVLVSLAGFTAFTAGPDNPQGAPATPVRAMRRALRSDPAAVLQGFYQACALPAHLAPEPDYADSGRLAQGLDGLLSWQVAAPTPLYALAAADDAVVNPQHSRANLEQTAALLEFLDHGGHAFPLLRPEETAAFIRRAIEDRP